MTSEDNHDDDAQLQQLRAVWVSMRDEEPPERGLAALMSAARSKAAELEHAAAPSWWQRVVATLRRPPVLALATVTLLLGGALLVTQRSSQLKVDDAAVEETATSPAAPLGDSHPTGELAAPTAGSAASSGTASALDSAVVTQEVAPSATATTERPRPRDAKSATKGKARPGVPPPVIAQPAPEVTAPAPVESGARSDGMAGGQAGLAIARDDAASAAPMPAPKKPIGRTAPSATEDEARAGAKDRAAPTLDKLVKQCESAATRGDCSAVRQIAAKILAASPAAYKTRVASNASIKECLSSPFDATSAE